MIVRLLPVLLLICSLFACTAGEPAPIVTPVSAARVLATVYISPTANAEEIAATRAASTATPIPPTATVFPTETPYVGLFIGEAQPEEGLRPFTQPIFGAEPTSSMPTADAGRCVIPIDTPYVSAWRANAVVTERMGCPIQGGFGFFGRVQLFENGVMYFYPDLNAVWALRLDRSPGSARGQFDYLENPPQLSTVGMQAPQGLLLPGDAFGSMWLSVEGLRAEMGYARTEAQEVAMGMQRFDNGTFLLDVVGEQVYALIVDGTVLGPYLAPGNLQPDANATVTINAPASATPSP